MNIEINQETHSVPEGASLKEVLRLSSMDEKNGIAVAVNQIIVPRANWSHSIIHENDTLTIIQATQGG
jgi:sulfur carrier protein